MDNNDFKSRAKALGIELNLKMLKQFEDYFNFLIDYNQKVNLTAITQKTEVYIKHFLDSFAPHFLIKQNATVVDVGAGAGFPGVPLKIVRPDINLVMVDSLNKRVTFLNEVINILKLDNSKALHFRAEDFAKKNRENFDCVLARAVAKLDTLSEYTLPLLKVGGEFLAYKTPEVQEELDKAQNAIKILGGKFKSLVNICLPNTDINRTFVIIKKNKKTPSIYPRDKNKPKTNPL